MKKIQKKITESYLHNAGLHYLQRFASSTGNFRRVMASKIARSCRAHPDQDMNECLKVLDSLIEKFQRSGLLDDKTYADGAVRSLRLKGASAGAILKKMQMKGVPPGAISEALRTFDENSGSGGDFSAAARYVRRRKLGPYATKKENKPEKDLAALARAGYSYEIAQRVLRMNTEEIEDIITAGS